MKNTGIPYAPGSKEGLTRRQLNFLKDLYIWDGQSY